MMYGFGSTVVATGGLGVVPCESRLIPITKASWARYSCDADSTLMANASHFDEVDQVRQIGRLVESMNEAGIDFWLSGGWAVDFHLGRVTRPHSDIDFIVS